MFGAADFYVLRDTAPEGCVSTPEFKPGIFGLLDKCANHYTVKCYPAVTPITLKADKFLSTPTDSDTSHTLCCSTNCRVEAVCLIVIL